MQSPPVANERVITVPGYGPGQLAEEILSSATKLGFTTAATGSGTFRLAKTERPKWATIAAIVGAPFLGLGLLFLLVKKSVDGTATIFEDREGTKVRLVGAASGQLADLLAGKGASAAQPLSPSASFSPQTPHGQMAIVAPAGTPSLISTTLFSPSIAPPSPAGAQMPSPSTYAAPSSFMPPNSTHSTQPVGPHSVAPTGVPSLLVPTAGEVADDDMDRTVARSSLKAFHAPTQLELALPDGRRIVVGPGVVLGRSPVQDPMLPAANLVPVNDPSLSKTHATFGVDATGIWLVDHHSTHGTTIIGGVQPVVCSPGVRIVIAPGTRLLLGELELLVGGTK